MNELTKYRIGSDVQYSVEEALAEFYFDWNKHPVALWLHPATAADMIFHNKRGWPKLVLSETMPRNLVGLEPGRVNREDPAQLRLI